jgi:hypothetical protein
MIDMYCAFQHSTMHRYSNWSDREDNDMMQYAHCRSKITCPGQRDDGLGRAQRIWSTDVFESFSSCTACILLIHYILFSSKQSTMY